METAENEKKQGEKEGGRFCISKEELNSLPIGRFHGRISVIYSQGAAERAAGFLLRSRMLGFDTETRPSFKKGESHPTALVQLSNYEHAFLFRISEMSMPPSLRRILEDRHIVKIGQDVGPDLKALKKEHKVEGRGFVDLLDISKRLECSPRGVKAMAAHFLGFRVSKAAQTTNWEARVLTEKQKVYAATDAWVCLAVYRKIMKMGLHESHVGSHKLHSGHVRGTLSHPKV